MHARSHTLRTSDESICKSQQRHDPSGSWGRTPFLLEHGRCVAHVEPARQEVPVNHERHCESSVPDAKLGLMSVPILQQGRLLSPETDRTPLHCGLSRRLLSKAHVAGHASGLLLRLLAQNVPALMSITKSVERHALLQLPRSLPSSINLHKGGIIVNTVCTAWLYMGCQSGWCHHACASGMQHLAIGHARCGGSCICTRE